LCHLLCCCKDVKGNASQQSESKSRGQNVVHSKSHSASFAKGLDERKQPVRGPWQRIGRFYAQSCVRGEFPTGTERVKRVPLVGKDGNPVQTVAQAITGLRRLRTRRSEDIGAINWSQVIPFNGMWPTASGAGISGNSVTNDFGPITSGYYPLWGTEMLVHLKDFFLAASGSNQKITADQLGDNTMPGTFMGMFNAQSVINSGVFIVGSIENEIELSKPGGATAIRLSDMVNKRASVGGKITPN
jgi:hypothetical protein